MTISKTTLPVNETPQERAARETAAALLINTVKQAEAEAAPPATIWDEKAKAEAGATGPKRRRFNIGAGWFSWIKRGAKT